MPCSCEKKAATMAMQTQTVFNPDPSADYSCPVVNRTEMDDACLGTLVTWEKQGCLSDSQLGAVKARKVISVIAVVGLLLMLFLLAFSWRS